MINEIKGHSTYFFISDTHINKNAAKLNSNFISMLRHFSTIPDSCLIINGDFLDFWFENSLYDLSQEYPMSAEISKIIIENSYPVYLIKGNRDFMAGKKFEKTFKIKVIGEECLVNLNGKKIYLTHGDIFCVNDRSYLVWRLFSRSFLLNLITIAIPRDSVFWIIKKLRSLSGLKKLRENKLDLSIVLSEVSKAIDIQKPDLIICGHNHTMRHIVLTGSLEKKETELVILHKLHKWGTYYLQAEKNGNIAIKVMSFSNRQL